MSCTGNTKVTRVVCYSDSHAKRQSQTFRVGPTHTLTLEYNNNLTSENAYIVKIRIRVCKRWNY